MTANIGEESKTSVEPYQYRGLYRTAKIPASAVSISGLRRLYTELSEKSREALDREFATYKKPPDQTTEEFENLKAEARRLGGLTVIVLGSRGEQIISDSIEGLNEERLPETISSITFDSSAALKSHDITLLNRFRLELDFTEPPSFYNYNPWDQPTPNNSSITVVGSDTTWVTAVYEYVISFFKSRQKHRGWLHNQTTFNLLNWVIGFPGAFWVVYRLDTQFQTAFQKMPGTLRGAIYVYIVLIALLVFRFIVAGFRWIFPIVELEDARSTRARGLLGTILSSIILALLYDVLKTLFGL